MSCIFHFHSWSWKVLPTLFIKKFSNQVLVIFCHRWLSDYYSCKYWYSCMSGSYKGSAETLKYPEVFSLNYLCCFSSDMLQQCHYFSMQWVTTFPKPAGLTWKKKIKVTHQCVSHKHLQTHSHTCTCLSIYTETSQCTRHTGTQRNVWLNTAI